MKASKPTSTALARVLALPIAAGLLAGCDYASKLPDAPTTLGYELQSQKPPSVTAQVVDPVGPPPPPLPAPVSAPSLPATPTFNAELTPPSLGTGLDTQALRFEADAGFEPPRTALALPPSPILPVPPAVGAVPETGLARLSTVGQPPSVDVSDYTPPPIDFAGSEYAAPSVGIAADPVADFAQYGPMPLGAEYGASLGDAPTMIETQPVAVASLPADSYDQTLSYESTSYDAPTFEQQTSTVLYDAPPLAEPLPFEVDAGQGAMVTTTPFVAAPAPQMSPITVLHARLDNGAIVNVHPVVGAPGATSVSLAQTISSELGAQVDQSALAFAPAVFDLRASASRTSSRAEAEWKLFSDAGALVGVFPEVQPSGNWSSMTDDEVRAMGRRVADRLRRNADLRRATLTSLASAPPITSIDYSAVLPSGAPSLAPMPRPRPTRMAQSVVPMQPVISQPTVVQSIPSFSPEPTQFAPLQAIPTQPIAAPQYAVNTNAIQPTDPMANAIPRRRPEGVRTASLSPVSIQPTPAPLPIQPVAPAPMVMQAPDPAPLGSILPSAPIAAPADIPAPSFNTLRAATDQASDGPRALVFRGVRGAPGNGDEALGREVSRLLGQSGAQLAPSGTPNALYLTADVSRTRNGGSDSIKIMWHVEESDGTRVGQVVQENDVPAGALDANWGEDAFYAAQGARDGIMELLRTSGALDA